MRIPDSRLTQVGFHHSAWPWVAVSPDVGHVIFPILNFHAVKENLPHPLPNGAGTGDQGKKEYTSLQRASAEHLSSK